MSTGSLVRYACINWYGGDLDLMNTIQKRLNHRRFDIAENVRLGPTRPGDIPSFWSDVVTSNVEGKLRAVKVFYEFSGGRRAFEKDIAYLGRNR